MPRETQRPDFQAYVVVKREGQDDFWLNVGAAFAHKDREGYNILLQALPIDGKIVLRPPKEPEAEDPPPQDDRRRNNTSSRSRR